MMLAFTLVVLAAGWFLYWIQTRRVTSDAASAILSVTTAEAGAS
jgi:hypothetical protein